MSIKTLGDYLKRVYSHRVAESLGDYSPLWTLVKAAREKDMTERTPAELIEIERQLFEDVQTGMERMREGRPRRNRDTPTTKARLETACGCHKLVDWPGGASIKIPIRTQPVATTFDNRGFPEAQQTTITEREFQYTGTYYNDIPVFREVVEA